MVVVLPEPFTPTTSNTKGFAVSVERLLRRQQDGGDRIGQRRDQRVDVVEFLARHFLAQLFEDLLRGVDAHVGGQQARFEFVEHLGVDLAAGHEVGEVIGEPRARTIDLRAHARDETLLGGWALLPSNDYLVKKRAARRPLLAIGTARELTAARVSPSWRL